MSRCLRSSGRASRGSRSRNGRRRFRRARARHVPQASWSASSAWSFSARHTVVERGCSQLRAAELRRRVESVERRRDRRARSGSADSVDHGRLRMVDHRRRSGWQVGVERVERRGGRTAGPDVGRRRAIGRHRCAARPWTANRDTMGIRLLTSALVTSVRWASAMARRRIGGIPGGGVGIAHQRHHEVQQRVCHVTLSPRAPIVTAKVQLVPTCYPAGARRDRCGTHARRQRVRGLPVRGFDALGGSRVDCPVRASEPLW